MQIVKIIFIGITIVTGVGLVLGFLFQSPRASGLGAISGTASRFKVRAPRDQFLERLTIICSVIFTVFVILLTVVDPEKLWK